MDSEITSRCSPPELDPEWVAAVSQMPKWRKLQMAAEMTQAARAEVKATLRHRYPDADEQEIRFRFAEQLLGSEMASRLCKKSAQETSV